MVYLTLIIPSKYFRSNLFDRRNQHNLELGVCVAATTNCVYCRLFILLIDKFLCFVYRWQLAFDFIDYPSSLYFLSLLKIISVSYFLCRPGIKRYWFNSRRSSGKWLLTIQTDEILMWWLTGEKWFCLGFKPVDSKLVTRQFLSVAYRNNFRHVLRRCTSLFQMLAPVQMCCKSNISTGITACVSCLSAAMYIRTLYAYKRCFATVTLTSSCDSRV